MKKFLLLITSYLLLSVGVSSCGVDDMYSGHQCYFIFNTEFHPSEVLKSSITGDNGFCLVYKGTVSGVDKVYIEKFGTTDPNSPYAYTTGLEPLVKDLVIGYDNGLLIGYSAIEQKLLAFDRHCPKCENNAKAKLQWNGSNSIVICPVCNSVYNLTLSGNGLDLYRNASYNDIILRVVN